MRQFLILTAAVIATLSGSPCSTGPVQAAEADRVLTPPSPGQVRDLVLEWVNAASQDVGVRERVASVWQQGSSDPASLHRLTELVVQSATVVLPQFQPLHASEPLDAVASAEIAAAIDRDVKDPFISANLRTALAMTLAERRLYDEALAQFAKVDLTLTTDPAGVLFFTAVSAQALLDVAKALSALDQLLTKTSNVPVRYSTVAALMQSDLAALDQQSLGGIAKLMQDSERRLDLGRSGEQVQGVQEKIVAGLDELIKKLEAQQGGGGGGSGQSGNSNESSAPANDSVIKGATAPGETDAKKFGKEGRWGDLPEKQQAEAKNLINRNFPSHYRQAVETYFKKLAGRPAAPGK